MKVKNGDIIINFWFWETMTPSSKLIDFYDKTMKSCKDSNRRTSRLAVFCFYDLNKLEDILFHDFFLRYHVVDVARSANKFPILLSKMDQPKNRQSTCNLQMNHFYRLFVGGRQ